MQCTNLANCKDGVFTMSYIYRLHYIRHYEMAVYENCLNNGKYIIEILEWLINKHIFSNDLINTLI